MRAQLNWVQHGKAGQGMPSEDRAGLWRHAPLADRPTHICLSRIAPQLALRPACPCPSVTGRRRHTQQARMHVARPPPDTGATGCHRQAPPIMGRPPQEAPPQYCTVQCCARTARTHVLLQLLQVPHRAVHVLCVVGDVAERHVAALGRPRAAVIPEGGRGRAGGGRERAKGFWGLRNAGEGEGTHEGTEVEAVGGCRTCGAHRIPSPPQYRTR